VTQPIVVTGTDTGIGKTVFAAALTGALEQAARAEYDPDVRLLLAHLHDRRDDPGPPAQLNRVAKTKPPFSRSSAST